MKRFFQHLVLNVTLVLFFITSAWADQLVITGERRAAIDNVKAIALRHTNANMALSRAGSSFHRNGALVFNKAVVGRFRGVVSQASELSIGGNVLTYIVIDPLPSNTEYSGSLSIMGPNSQFEYQISYDDLLPLALLAQSGGTSLYSLTSNIRQASQEATSIREWAKESGMVVDQNTVVAIELSGTRFFRALEFVDLCYVCEGQEFPQIANNINRKNNAHRPTSIVDESWIITDIDIPFEVTVVQGTLEIDTTLTRDSWILGNTKQSAFVTNVVEISGAAALQEIDTHVQIRSICIDNAECDGVVDQIDSLLHREARLLGMDVAEAAGAQLNYSPLKKRSVAEIEIAEFVFETLALFRHAKNSRPEEWNTFITSISNDAMIGGNLNTWERYTASLEKAYAE